MEFVYTFTGKTTTLEVDATDNVQTKILADPS